MQYLRYALLGVVFLASAGLSQAATTTASSTDSIPPSKPSKPTSFSVTTNSIGISWQPSTDNVRVTQYEVWRSGTFIKSTATTSYQDTGLVSNKAYSYMVRARDAAGNTGPFSAAATITTKKTPYFLTGDQVKTVYKSTVYAASTTGASTTIAKIGIQSKNSSGAIVSGPIYASGYTLWNVNFATGTDGYVRQAFVTRTGSTTALSQANLIETIRTMIAKLQKKLETLTASVGSSL